MNCTQFNTIKLEEVLFAFGHLPTKQNEKEAWYLNPFANESQASFKLNKTNNIWYLHSEGIGGNNIDFMQRYLKASVKEVLEWARKQNFSSFQPQTTHQIRNFKSNYKINEVKELKNENLKRYLNQRGLSPIVFPILKEIHFEMNDKSLYAIGFENLSGGWELRNSFYKGSLMKKDISIIQSKEIQENQIQNSNQKIQKSVSVFEGFMDALSYIELNKNLTEDLLVMNSIALLKKTKVQLEKYSEINLYLDNDKAGEFCKNEILKTFPEVKDQTDLYKDFKDLNAYLIENPETQNQIHFKKSPATEIIEEQQEAIIYKRRR